MEVFDLDVGKIPEYVGRIAVHPKIQLHSNQPNKKPRFEWHESEETVLSPASPVLPFTRRYRLECLFWGIRGHGITSTVVANAFTHNNFDQPLQWIEIELPENALYLPPLTVKLYDHRNLCKPHFEGACMIPSLKPYLKLPRRGRAQKTTQISKAEFGTAQTDCIIEIEEKDVYNEDTSEKTPLLSVVRQALTKKARNSEVAPKDQNVNIKSIQLDWWSKLYASEGNTKHSYKNEHPGVSVVKLKIYDRELESIPEFNGFTDLVQQFSIVKGHRCMNEEPPEVAKLKTGFSLVRLMENEDAEKLPTELNPPAVLEPLESRQSVRVLVHLYIVRGRRLKAKDIDGLSDPYIVINTNLGQRISDREHYIKGDLNPIFGRCFEMVVTLPSEYQLKVSVMDRDETGHDDLIGQTLIDIENRLMSRHRAHCGISARYDSSGYNAWRDGELPSQILKSLCEQHSIPQPKVQGLQMTVGPLTVVGHPEASSEQLALAVLRRWDEVAGWSLVPEHVESRSLTVPRRPGVEQGRLHMWLDLFPEKGPPPNPRVNISPRTPSAYELRVIVWNAEEIPLDDTNLLGEKMSDIFFKCWLGEKKNQQSTDIHYRSLTGEAQFNWRMVFPFRYWPMTGRMVTKKEVIAGMFARGEQKIPCILTVQAWDADLISANDFLSSVSLELCHMPQGAKTAKSCNLANISIRPSLNLFKLQRTRGWWPLKDDQGNMAGKVELELDIVTKEEAATRPAGKGRDPPRALPEPQRLDTNFFWLMNPGRALKYLLWRPCRKTILCILFVTPCILAFIAFPMIWLNKVF
ncbi:hypothetical protein B566_EDAN009586 [Ephemera danica]|nr:hypothetical protein B566_EDAN009586 [Ephemera danica]